MIAESGDPARLGGPAPGRPLRGRGPGGGQVGYKHGRWIDTTLLQRGLQPGTYGRGVTASRFVVQLHDATTLHFDLRLRFGDVLRSSAVPRGPSFDPAARRLAAPVEDHSLDAGELEGVHQGQALGSGAVIIWDQGPAYIRREEPGHLSFVLHGRKLTGGFALTRTGPRRWILVKARDDEARPGSDIVAEQPASVRTGRTWQDLT